MRRLNRLLAFFLPLATLVVVFGMHPPGQLFRQQGFWLVLAALVANASHWAWRRRALGHNRAQ
ncbi:MAG: hypothetical protein WED15_04120 [Akkermansiaceae bacterium]